MSPQIQKQQFVNNDAGWVGAVVIGPKGDELGVAVEPGGTVWLSEPEQILTANAPRRPEDNPFLPQVRQWLNPDTGTKEDLTVTPLAPIDEGRFVPANARPIPSDLAAASAAQAAATGDEPFVLVSSEGTAASREAEVLAQGDTARPGVPPSPSIRAQAAAAAAAQATEVAPDAPAPTPVAEEPAVTPPVVPDEIASQSPGPASEETGAAVTPTADAPEGEYAAKEEVGTPGAAAAGPPAPWSPGSEG